MIRVSIRGTEVCLGDKIFYANTLPSRFLGLMGRRSLPEGGGILLCECSQIHMFFMRMELDILFISREMKVLKTLQALRRWQISPFVSGSRYVLELPIGVIEKTGVKFGDELLFEKVISFEGGQRAPLQKS
jgi:uncharacterized membrane protein (UPF0127 family)